MKRLFSLFAAAGLVLAAGLVWAANSVDVTGDLTRDGNLMIEVSWTVDTAKYKGDSPDAIHKQVYEEIWNKTYPQLVKKTKGMAVSYDKGNFAKITETKQLMETRADGTKVYAYNATLKFSCPMGEASTPARTAKEHEASVEKEYHYRFVNEGRD